MYITDQEPMFSLMEHNIVLNGLQRDVKALILNWCVYQNFPLTPLPPGARPFHISRIFLFYFILTVLLITFSRGEPLPDEVRKQRPNVVLAADCVYFEPAFPLLLATLEELFSLDDGAKKENDKMTIYFCFKKRRRADMQFLKKAQKKFCVTEVVDEDRPVFSREGLFLFTFTRKGTKAAKSAGVKTHQKQ